MVMVIVRVLKPAKTPISNYAQRKEGARAGSKSGKPFLSTDDTGACARGMQGVRSRCCTSFGDVARVGGCGDGSDSNGTRGLPIGSCGLGRGLATAPARAAAGITPSSTISETVAVAVVARAKDVTQDAVGPPSATLTATTEVTGLRAQSAWVVDRSFLQPSTSWPLRCPCTTSTSTSALSKLFALIPTMSPQRLRPVLQGEAMRS